ncbi:MAG: LPXTG cell wall anchor domain-containing protein [Atopobiaceae bacterium]|nr:LPXTG cell wall anchor domain-containing protein [Atopobiaceae bacterium]
MAWPPPFGLSHPGYALPHTGGRGVQVLYALGVVLVAGASVVALRRRRAQA